MRKGEEYQTTDEDVMVMTGLGKTIERARSKVYAAVDKVHFPNRMFRRDIGCKVIETLPEMHRFGYLRDMAAS
jgi:phosphoribosylamine--glycine ligase